MEKPAISIIIPTYNYGPFISRAIDSALSQTFPPIEVIVVDDGSIDNTGKIVSSYQDNKELILIIYLKKENGGPAAARNFGIEHAKGEFLLLLDADDALYTTALENLVKPVKEDPSVDLVIGGYVSVFANGKQKQKSAPVLNQKPEENFKAYLKKNISISHGNFLIKRSVFNRIRYPEYLRASEDQSVFAQLLAICKSLSVNKHVARKFHRNDTLRHNSELQVDAGLKVVDAVFDPEILPPGLFRYKTDYYVNRCLSLFRILYKDERLKEAEYYFKQAIIKSGFALFRWSYLEKYIKLQLRKILTKF